MEISKISAMAETPEQHESWIDWFKNIQFFAIALIIPLWRLIDKYFEYQSKKDREFIKSVVEESISGNMREIKEDIQELKKAMNDDRKETSKAILDLTREINKRS